MSEYPLFQNRELAGTGREYLLMKTVKMKGVTGKFTDFLLQIKKLQIAKVIFQVIGGIFHDHLVDLFLNGVVCNPQLRQEGGAAFLIPAVIVDYGIEKRHHTKIQRAVKPGKLSVSGIGLIISIGKGFCISCPSFHVTTHGRKVSDGIRGGRSECDRLIKMPRKSFVRQSGI